MKNLITLVFAVLLLAFLGCSEENPYPTSTNEEGIDLAKGPKEPKPPKGPALGTCPDIYYESSKTLKNGAIVAWSSSFNGFDYAQGTDYTVTLTYSVLYGNIEEVAFGAPKKKTWTPKGVSGEVSFNLSTDELTVNMNPMHRSVEPNWQGYIGNGHFKLVLEVTDADGGNPVTAKLGVNVHLEDPDPGSSSRCP